MGSSTKSTVDHIRQAASSGMAPPLTTTALGNTCLINPSKHLARLAINKDWSIYKGLQVVTIAQIFYVQFDCSSYPTVGFPRDNPDRTVNNFGMRKQTSGHDLSAKGIFRYDLTIGIKPWYHKPFNGQNCGSFNEASIRDRSAKECGEHHMCSELELLVRWKLIRDLYVLSVVAPDCFGKGIVS